MPFNLRKSKIHNPGRIYGLGCTEVYEDHLAFLMNIKSEYYTCRTWGMLSLYLSAIVDKDCGRWIEYTPLFHTANSKTYVCSFMDLLIDVY
jgi:hypothetical protein